MTPEQRHQLTEAILACRQTARALSRAEGYAAVRAAAQADDGALAHVLAQLADIAAGSYARDTDTRQREASMHQYYASADDAKATIVEAIEAGGAATREEYDLDAVFAAVYQWDTHHQAYYQAGDTDALWSAVQAADLTAGTQDAS